MHLRPGPLPVLVPDAEQMLMDLTPSVGPVTLPLGDLSGAWEGSWGCCKSVKF